LHRRPPCRSYRCLLQVSKRNTRNGHLHRVLSKRNARNGHPRGPPPSFARKVVEGSSLNEKRIFLPYIFVQRAARLKHPPGHTPARSLSTSVTAVQVTNLSHKTEQKCSKAWKSRKVVNLDITHPDLVEGTDLVVTHEGGLVLCLGVIHQIPLKLLALHSLLEKPV
jgi:hypothetical protein